MKKFFIINKMDDFSINLAHEMRNVLINHGLKEDKDNPSLCISIGGDGTMLKAIHHFQNKLDKVHFVGVHTGTLGFYTDFVADEVDLLLDYIINNKYKDIAFRMLEVTINHQKGSSKFYALNEARVENNHKTQVVDVSFNGQYFETFRGNGLNFCTPSGSTGYNKSLGGPILHPKSDAYVMTEIAAINNVAYRTIESSLVLSSEHTCKIIIEQVEGNILGIDSKTYDLSKSFKNISSIEFKLSEKSVNFIRYRDLPFLVRVRNNFIGQ